MNCTRNGSAFALRLRLVIFSNSRNAAGAVPRCLPLSRKNTGLPGATSTRSTRRLRIASQSPVRRGRSVGSSCCSRGASPGFSCAKADPQARTSAAARIERARDIFSVRLRSASALLYQGGRLRRSRRAPEYRRNRAGSEEQGRENSLHGVFVTGGGVHLPLVMGA